MIVRRVATEHDLLALRDGWNALAAAEDAGGLWSSFEWFHAAWTCERKRLQLYVLVVEDQQRLRAIAPLVRQGIRYWGVPVWRIGFARSDVPGGFVLDAKEALSSVAAISRWLAEKRDEWDLIWLRNVREESVLASTLIAGARAHRLRWALETSMASPYVVVDRTWESYYKSLSVNLRSIISNKLNRLKKIGDPIVDRYSSPPEVERGIEAVNSVADHSWQGAQRTAISSARDRYFYDALAKAASARGWLDLFVLRCGPRPIAFEFNVTYRGKVHALKWGYDSEWAQYSPGVLLRRFTSEALFNRGVAEIDLMGGIDSFKLRWTKAVRQHVDLTLFGRMSLLMTALLVWKKHIAPPLRKVAALRRLWHAVVRQWRSRVRPMINTRRT